MKGGAHFIGGISQLIRENKPFLQNVKENSRSTRNICSILKNASKEQLLSFVETCFNLLKGKIPLKRKQLNKLKTHAQLIRKIARVRTPLSARRLLLQGIKQRGNGIPLLPALLSSIILPVIGEATNLVADRIMNKNK